MQYPLKSESYSSRFWKKIRLNEIIHILSNLSHFAFAAVLNRPKEFQNSNLGNQDIDDVNVAKITDKLEKTSLGHKENDDDYSDSEEDNDDDLFINTNRPPVTYYSSEESSSEDEQEEEVESPVASDEEESSVDH